MILKDSDYHTQTGKSHVQHCGVPVFFPCTALLGKRAKDCSCTRRNVSSKESLDSAGSSHDSCSHLRLDYGNQFIHLVFSVSSKNILEGNHRQKGTADADAPHHQFKYVDTRKGCKFTFWSLCVCLTKHICILRDTRSLKGS